MASEENTTTPKSAAPPDSAPVQPTPRAVDTPLDPPVDAQPRHIPGLSPAQEKALAALVDGKLAIEAAEAAGVSRTTIYRWQHGHREFMKALNLCRQQTHDAFCRRLATLNVKALSLISTMLDKGDFRAAKLVISFVDSQRDLEQEKEEAKKMLDAEEWEQRWAESQKRNAE